MTRIKDKNKVMVVTFPKEKNSSNNDNLVCFSNHMATLKESIRIHNQRDIIKNLVYVKVHTSLLRAEAADPRSAGSMERRVSISAKAGAGNSLKVSATQRL